MGRSYLGSRENISTGQIILFCSYGEMFSRLPGKVSRGDVDFVQCKQKVFPLSGKVVFIWDKNYLGHRDLACHQARSRLAGKLFASYERKLTFHTISVRKRDLACKLVEMFLGNRDNFCPYEQALSVLSRGKFTKYKPSTGNLSTYLDKYLLIWTSCPVNNTYVVTFHL